MGKGVLVAATIAALTGLVWAASPAPPDGPRDPFELYDLAGKLFRLEQFSKAPETTLIAVDFFWDGCAPCKKALPKWAALYQKYHSRGFRVVIVDVRAGDDIATAKAKARAYFSKHPVPFPVVFDKYNVVARSYGVVDSDNSVSLPQVFLLDPTGKQLLQTPRCQDAADYLEKHFK
jgi:thiol-disulfide isomerase/thioredoxin